MACTEAYREHIMYTFHGFCKVVIRHAAITVWRNQQRRHKREISLEYLTEEKFYPLGTTDEYFTAPYEEYPVTICGQTIVLTNGETCRCPALSAGTKTGNHLPVLFQALQTVENRENVRTLPEYSRVSNPQDVEAPAERKGVLSSNENQIYIVIAR